MVPDLRATIHFVFSAPRDGNFDEGVPGELLFYSTISNGWPYCANRSELRALGYCPFFHQAMIATSNDLRYS